MAENKNILVVGGCGYIGSHTALALKEHGYNPIILDNFSTGPRFNKDKLNVKLIEGDLGDKELVVKTLKENNISCVMHFAAFAYVGESVTAPAKYYKNNVSKTIQLLTAMAEAGVKQFIFSSTCATYGIPEVVPITLSNKQAPINPYGRTKLIVENILPDFENAYGIKSVVLRYFNASGAHPSGLLGEHHNPETHLIPLAIDATTEGKSLTIFGTDYETADGTCIRDYVHVCDLADAHIWGIEHLTYTKTSTSRNIGTGEGNSVMEVIKMVEHISGKKVNYVTGPRRAGDPPVLVAEKSWKTKYSFKEIIESAIKSPKIVN